MRMIVKAALLPLALLIGTPAMAQDAALLAKAQQTAAVIVPKGSVEKMMGPMMEKMIRPMMGQMSELPVRDLARMVGAPEADLQKIGQAKISEVMAILDPAFHPRMEVSMTTMFREMGPLMGQFEPDMRSGMAKAFANRYDAAELDAINAFLATPAGNKFGSGFMMLATDPAYLESMQAMMPKVIEAMPAIIGKVTQAVAKLPKPRKVEQLSADEKKKLSELLGVSPDTLNKK
jgi:hypothetical protein